MSKSHRWPDPIHRRFLELKRADKGYLSRRILRQMARAQIKGEKQWPSWMK